MDCKLCDEHKIKRIYVGGSVRILKSSLLEYKGLVLQRDCKGEMSSIQNLQMRPAQLGCTIYHPALLKVSFSKKIDEGD